MFFLDLASKLSKYMKIKNQAIKLIDSQHPSYKPIYSLETEDL